MLRKMVAFVTLGLVALVSNPADAAFAVTNLPTSANGGGPQYLGFTFKVAQTITVSSLGIYVPTGNTSITAGQSITLIDLQSNAYTTTTLGAITQGTFDYAGTTSFTLNTTDNYEIYSYVGIDPKQYGAQASVFSPDILMGQTGYNDQTKNLGLGQAPSLFNYTLTSLNFQYIPGVPEPASIGMMGLGLVGAFLVRRKMAKRSA